MEMDEKLARVRKLLKDRHERLGSWPKVGHGGPVGGEYMRQIVVDGEQPEPEPCEKCGALPADDDDCFFCRQPSGSAQDETSMPADYI